MEKMTPQGKQQLENELARLEYSERPALAKRLKIAISYGDLSENAEYADAKDEQAKLEHRIAEIRARLRTARIVEQQSDNMTIQVGSTFEASANGSSRIFSIVGREESDPLRGNISFDSPLGAAFVGKKGGDVVEATTPGGKKTYRVEKIIHM